MDPAADICRMIYIQRFILKACLSVLLQKHVKETPVHISIKKPLEVQLTVRAKSLPAESAMSRHTSAVFLRIALWVITRWVVDNEKRGLKPWREGRPGRRSTSTTSSTMSGPVWVRVALTVAAK